MPPISGFSKPWPASAASLCTERDLKLIVFCAGCSYRERLEGLLAASGIVAARRLEFGTLDGILGCVAAGIGVTMLPRAVIASNWLDVLAVHEPPGGGERVDTIFIRRRDAFAPSALEAFLGFARPAPFAREAAE